MPLDLEILRRDGESALIVARDEGQSEGLDLEFKEDVWDRKPIFDESGKLTREGRTLVGKTMSAFANSVGGLLVLVIECRQNDGIDEISRLSPMRNIKRRSAAVQAAISELLHPRHDTALVQMVPSAQAEDVGYIGISVPRSERRPHRSVSDQRYYRRSGTSSMVMEHFELEDMFSRRSSAILSVAGKLVAGNKGGNSEGAYQNIRGEIMVRNEGFASARDISIELFGLTGLDAPIGGDSGSIREVRHGSTWFRPPSDFVLNPFEGRVVAQVSFTIQRLSPDDDVGLQHSMDRADWHYRTNYRLFAADIRPATGIIAWGLEDFLPFEDMLPP